MCSPNYQHGYNFPSPGLMDAVDFFSKKLFNSFTFSISYRLVSPPTEMKPIPTSPLPDSS
jgi:hypothetical protein